jgi:hypothetical protein
VRLERRGEKSRRDGAVVVGDAREGACCGATPPCRIQAPRLERVQEGFVLRRIGQHRHPSAVLGGGTCQRRTADVDGLDGQRGAGAGGGEIVEVHHQEIDRLQAVRFEVGDVRRLAAIRENAGVQRRMQGLDPAAQHLRKVGHVLDGGDGQSRGFEMRRRAAGSDELNAAGRERATQLGETALVGDRKQSAPQRHRGCGRRAGGGNLGKAHRPHPLESSANKTASAVA